jgi:hypothetical protein
MTRTITGPRGWSAGKVLHRLADSKPLPQTFSKTDRTIDCVISMGSPVKRFYGTEILRIDASAVIKIALSLAASRFWTATTNRESATRLGK